MVPSARTLLIPVGAFFAFICAAALPGAARRTAVPDLCKCRYEALYDELFGWVLMDCYRVSGQCLTSCQEGYMPFFGYWKCLCDGVGELCTCYGVTQNAGVDPETTCVNVGCSAGLHCREPWDSEASGGWYVWCNCRHP